MESYCIMLLSSGSRSNNDFSCSTRFFDSEFFSTNYPIGFDFLFNFFDVLLQDYQFTFSSIFPNIFIGSPLQKLDCEAHSPL